MDKSAGLGSSKYCQLALAWNHTIGLQGPSQTLVDRVKWKTHRLQGRLKEAKQLPQSLETKEHKQREHMGVNYTTPRISRLPAWTF